MNPHMTRQEHHDQAITLHEQANCFGGEEQQALLLNAIWHAIMASNPQLGQFQPPATYR